MKKDVLFLCQFFYPEYNSSAVLPFDTATALVAKGFSVGALCGYPKEYNKVGTMPKKEVKDGVAIKRVKYLQCKRNHKLGRLVNYVSFTGKMFLRIFELRKYKAVMVYSNPPILPLVAICAHRLFQTKIIFVSYDVYPEVAYASRSLTEEGVIAKAMSWLNHKLFKEVSMVVALTEEMKTFLLQHRSELTPSRIVVIPNWAHEEKISLKMPDYCLKDEKEFVVSYFGNLGICQDIRSLCEAIELLQKEPNIHFLIAGHGSKMLGFQRQVQKYPNVSCMDFLNGTDFLKALKSSSCGIVSLEKGLKGMCAPSKYYSYLHSGTPVIAIVEENSYLAKEIQEQELGFVTPQGDGKSLAKAIKTIYRQRETRYKMGKSASNLYQQKYNIASAQEKYERLICEILEQ